MANADQAKPVPTLAPPAMVHLLLRDGRGSLPRAPASSRQALDMAKTRLSSVGRVLHCGHCLTRVGTAATCCFYFGLERERQVLPRLGVGKPKELVADADGHGVAARGELGDVEEIGRASCRERV